MNSNVDANSKRNVKPEFLKSALFSHIQLFNNFEKVSEHMRQNCMRVYLKIIFSLLNFIENISNRVFLN